MKKTSTATETRDLSLTIYNGGFAAVKEIREINLNGNEDEIIFADVAQQIETNSLLVDGIEILEFNYDYDLISKQKLLKKYINKEVFLRDRQTGEKKSCRLLSVEDYGTNVLEDNKTKEIYIEAAGELILPALSAGLMIKPALIWKIIKSSADNVNVSYLSQGFKWTANYVIEVLKDTLNIAGWSEIENKSGTGYENAKIKLIAGDVKRVKDYSVARRHYEYEEMQFQVADRAESLPEEKSFFDYHMYTLNKRTSLKNNQTKQVKLLNGFKIPFKKYYVLDLSCNKVNVIVEFTNIKENGLGIPIPGGKAKVYKADEADNSLEFIGEDRISHTPKNQDIKLNIGNAFDITFEYSQVDTKTMNKYFHYKNKCIINNNKEEDVEVHFECYMTGIWEILKSTHDYVSKSADLVEFIVLVKANSEERIFFEYRSSNA